LKFFNAETFSHLAPIAADLLSNEYTGFNSLRGAHLVCRMPTTGCLGRLKQSLEIVVVLVQRL